MLIDISLSHTLGGRFMSIAKWLGAIIGCHVLLKKEEKK